MHDTGYHSYAVSVTHCSCSNNTRFFTKLETQADTLATRFPFLLSLTLPGACLSRSPTFKTDCSTCSKGYSAVAGYSCRRCTAKEKGLSAGVAVVVFALFYLLPAIWFGVHLEKMLSGESRGRPPIREGFVERKLVFFWNMVTKVLPLAAIKIVVVVWQIVFQVRTATTCCNIGRCSVRSDRGSDACVA